MNFNDLTKSILKGGKYLLLLIAVGTFFIALSSFHQTNERIDINNVRIAECVTQWYELFLKLESKDVKAYPPISAERLAKMGLAGHLTYEQFKHSNFKSEEEFLLALNEVYSKLLSNIFIEIKNSPTLISELHKKIETEYLISVLSLQIVSERVETILQKIEQTPKFLDIPDNRSPIRTDIFSLKRYDYCEHDAILPNWGEKSTYYVDKQQIKLNLPFSSSNSLDQAIQYDALSVYTQAINISNEDKWIAEFWSDDVRGLTFSPAGRWISITNQLVQHENLNKESLFNLYLRLGIGLNDGAILCWKYKYLFHLERPSDYINQYIDSKWEPLHEDPNFPSYPSGHSVLGAVAASILENTFGENYAFTDNSHQNRPEFFSNQRKFVSIRDAAIENSYSRFLLGVHFREDCEAGLRLGFEIGQSINEATNDDLLKKAKTFELN